jgi:trehalose utilization protein
MSWFEGGNVCRSGVAFQRDAGRIFYFSPGHETYPIYHNENVLKVLGNAIRWANPVNGILPPRVTPQPQPMEEIRTPNPLENIDTKAFHEAKK